MRTGLALSKVLPIRQAPCSLSRARIASVGYNGVAEGARGSVEASHGHAARGAGFSAAVPGRRVLSHLYRLGAPIWHGRRLRVARTAGPTVANVRGSNRTSG